MVIVRPKITEEICLVVIVIPDWINKTIRQMFDMEKDGDPQDSITWIIWHDGIQWLGTTKKNFDEIW